MTDGLHKIPSDPPSALHYVPVQDKLILALRVPSVLFDHASPTSRPRFVSTCFIVRPPAITLQHNLFALITSINPFCHFVSLLLQLPFPVREQNNERCNQSYEHSEHGTRVLYLVIHVFQGFFRNPGSSSKFSPPLRYFFASVHSTSSSISRFVRLSFTCKPLPTSYLFTTTSTTQDHCAYKPKKSYV